MGLRILIVDDEECIRDSLQMHLSEKGHDVTTRAHPSRCDGSANRLCHGYEECADVLIIDQWMPQMTGIEYLARRHDWGCRAVGQRKALISANLPDHLHAQAIELGCTVFDKPVSLGQIELWIEEKVAP
jgi:CheY-like chemotaxis protein